MKLLGDFEHPDPCPPHPANTYTFEATIQVMSARCYLTYFY